MERPFWYDPLSPSHSSLRPSYCTHCSNQHMQSQTQNCLCECFSYIIFLNVMFNFSGQSRARQQNLVCFATDIITKISTLTVLSFLNDPIIPKQPPYLKSNLPTTLGSRIGLPSVLTPPQLICAHKIKPIVL